MTTDCAKGRKGCRLYNFGLDSRVYNWPSQNAVTLSCLTLLYISGGGMNCVGCDICVYHLGLCVFFPGVCLSSRVTGACPVTTDLIVRVNVRTTTTTTHQETENVSCHPLSRGHILVRTLLFVFHRARTRNAELYVIGADKCYATEYSIFLLSHINSCLTSILKESVATQRCWSPRKIRKTK